LYYFFFFFFFVTTMNFLLVVVACCLIAATMQMRVHATSSAGNWTQWLDNFGHDTYQYPEWINAQREACKCSVDAVTNVFSCHDDVFTAAADNTLTWCNAKKFLLAHMPDFDKHFMPPSVTIRGDSMFDDNIAFALMADNATSFSQKLPLPLKLSYGLPYASYHEARVNWRPLFFAKFFQLIAGAISTQEAISRLVAPNVFLNWSTNVWPSHPTAPLDMQTDYNLAWSSSTSPPIINPFSFIAYGYSSCSGWATFLTYMARAVGIPARQVGTPCWNQPLGGVDYSGLAKDNPNVSICWKGGIGSANGGVGGDYLNNHNWVEYWDTDSGSWVFLNDPPTTAEPDAGLCGNFSKSTGCGYSPDTGCEHATGPGLAMRDHEIFAITWSNAADSNRWLQEQGLSSDIDIDGGPIVDASTLKLSNGEDASPLVWSPLLQSPVGELLKNTGLRVVNRTDFYRCRIP
jgi:hypothetical protein